MPSDIKPMLTTVVDQPFSDEGWQFELKLDGYRTLAYLKWNFRFFYHKRTGP